MVEIFLSESKWRGRFLRYAPLILWMSVVLYASTGNASMAQTSRFISPLLEFLFPNAPDETLAGYHAFIRKCAHFTEYAILGFWAARAFSTSAVKILQKYWYVFSFLLAVTVASIDETNQSFNPARTGTPRDVLLDSIGALFAVALFYWAKRRRAAV